MKVTTQQRQLFYFSISEVYRLTTGLAFKWSKGEKPRIYSAFKLFGLNFSQDFDECFDEWVNYLNLQTSQWNVWDKRERSNFIGFICNKDRLVMYAQKQRDKNAKEASKVGVKAKEDYYF